MKHISKDDLTTIYEILRYGLGVEQDISDYLAGEILKEIADYPEYCEHSGVKLDEK